jgi:hypothetical protein
MLLVCALVTTLAREGCEKGSRGAADPALAGWTVRHEIDPRHPRADTLLRQLADRPSQPGGRETVLTAPGREPSVVVVDANGVERWRGDYPREAGAGFAPDLLIATVAAGHALPPVVPLFCLPPSPSS